MENKELIIAEFNRDVDKVAAIYTRWGAGGLADTLNTIARNKAVAESSLTKAMLSPDEAKARSLEFCGRFRAGLEPDWFIAESILQGLTASQSAQYADPSTPEADDTAADPGSQGAEC